MNFRGKVTYPDKGFYASLIWPLVQLKKFFETIHDFLIKIIWSELIQGETIVNEWASLLLFVIFTVFSIAVYRLEDYKDIILIGFVVVWFLDIWLARQRFIRGKKTLVLLEKQKENKIFCGIFLPGVKRIGREFESDRVECIYISQNQVRSGAFEEVLGTVWHIEVALENDCDVLVDEHRRVIDAVKKAKVLANYFKVPIIFKSSQGEGKYAEQNLSNQLALLKTIKIETNKQRWQIYLKWQLNKLGNLFKEIWKESGFFLFLLILSGFMFHYGNFANGILEFYLGRNSGVIEVHNIWVWFAPKLELLDIAEFALAIFIIVFKGWEISREKHIIIDRYRLQFFLNKKKISQVKTREIESILLLEKPSWTLLILSKDKAITIRNFQEEKELTTLAIQLEKAVKEFS